MTIEFSLRQRAIRSHRMAFLYLMLTVTILVGTYFTIPMIAAQALALVGDYLHISGSSAHSELLSVCFAVGMLAVGLSAIASACFLLGRTGIIELALAARSIALADALCLTDGNFENFEKTANLLVPKDKYFSMPDVLSRKNREVIVEMLKLAHK